VSVLNRKLRRDIGRQGTQFAAIALTLALGIALFGASYDAYGTLRHSYSGLFDRLAVPNLWVSGGRTDEIAAQASATRGVAAVAVRTQADVPVQLGEDALLGRIVGTTGSIDRLLVEHGSQLAPGDGVGVLVEHHVADHFGLRPGATVVVVGASGPETLTVRGVVSSAEYLWPARGDAELFTSPDQFGAFFVSEATARRVGGGAGLQQVLVRYQRGAHRVRLDAALTAMSRDRGATDIYPWAKQSSNAILQEDVRGFGELALLFPLLFLSAAGLGAWALITRLVLAQRPVIGMLVASGAPPGPVRRHYLGYGVAAALAGAVPGVVAGLALAVVIAHLYTHALSLPITVVRLSPWMPVLGVTAALAVGALAAWGPARRATRVDPAEAMRGTVPVAAGSQSLLERALPPLRTASASTRLVLRNVGRDRRRTAATGLAVVLALVLVLTGWGMRDTVQVLLARQFSRVETQDAALVVDGSPAAMLDRIRAVPGVSRAEPAVQAPVVIRAAGGRAVTTLRAVPPATTMHGFAPEARRALEGGGLVVGTALNRSLHTRVGDLLDVGALSGGPVVRERVARLVDEPLGTFAYVSLTAATPAESAQRVIPEVLVRFRPGVDRGALDRRLRAVDGVLAVQDTHALAATVRSYLRLFDVVVGAMLAAGALLAAGLLYMGMTVAVAQRQVELATLEAFGVPFRRLRRVVTAENLTVACLALAPGVLAGWLTARAFMASFQTEDFSFPLTMRASTPILAAGFVLAVAVLAQRPGLRRIAQLDVSAIVRERAL
jgi:putative ABC transport system permease protein